MKLRLFHQEQSKLRRILTIIAVTTLSAIGTISCNQNDDVLVTEIAISPPNRRVAETSPAGNLYVKAKNQHIKGNLQDAIATYTEAIELDQEYGAVYNSRGLAYFDSGDKQKAIADYNRAIDLSPSDAEAYNNRGNALAALGDRQRAIADYNRGNARAALGDNNGAIEDFNEAINLNSRFAIVYNNRGNARAALGDSKGAIADYDQAIKLNSSFGSAYNNRGNARAALGDKQGALKDLQKAASIFEAENNQNLYQEVMKNIQELGQ